MKMWIPWGKTMGILTLIALIGFGLGLLGLGGAENLPLVDENPRVPAVLKVCMGCTYSSIQAAVDAAQPGDIVKVYWPFILWPSSIFHPADDPIAVSNPPNYFVGMINIPTWVENVTISKPLTIEAKPTERFGLISLDVPYALVTVSPATTEKPIFDITADSGQVVIRGFSLYGVAVRWSGGADLVLERNHINLLPRSSYDTLIDLQGGARQAQLIDNKIQGILELNGARAILRSNRIEGRIRISGMINPDRKGMESEVALEQNFIEGSIKVGAGSRVRIEDNLLIGSAVGEGVSRYGLLLEVGTQEDGEVWVWPIVVQANRNVIVRYEKGIALGYNCDDLQTLAVLQLSGQKNVIEQNGQDLCPADYPWPPGFRK